MWSIYSKDPGVDRHHLIFISSRGTKKIHTLSFPTFGQTCSFQDFVHPDGRVVSYLLSFFLCSLRYNLSPSRILFGCRERCGRMLIVVSLPSSSVISPQWPPSGASLGSHNVYLQMFLQLFSTNICGRIDHMYIYRDTEIMQVIL